MTRHADIYGETTNHESTIHSNDELLTQQQTTNNGVSDDALHSVARLQMDDHDNSTSDAFEEHSDGSDSESTVGDEDENYAKFTDKTDHEAVTFVEEDNFSDNENEEIDGQTERNDINLAEIHTTFHEHVEPEFVDPVLTNPLRGKFGEVRPTGQLKEGVAEKFHTIFDCVKFCGGLDILFFRRITANSNENAGKGSAWQLCGV